jgi:2-polyprenyl-3-methyl-5-hydroxy-6-metoxy-1,4-benzoquinol methylase
MSENGITSVEGVLEQLTGLWRTAIVRAAVELHVADHVNAGAETAVAVAAAEHADARAVATLMDALAALGFLEKDGERYGLEPIVSVLLPAMGRFGPVYLNEPTWTMWGSLSEAVRTGKPVASDGGEYWLGFARASRELAHLQGMSAREFAGLGAGVGARIVDVGCGSGGMGYAFAIADPSATVTAIDSEDVLAIAADYAEELHIAERIEFKALDVATAESLGDGDYDLALVSNMLHLFDPGGNRELLRKTAATLRRGGRILVTEIVPDDERSRSAYALMFAVEMLLRTPGGNVWTFAEIAGWLAAAGFVDVEQHPMIGHTMAITATRA